MSDLKPCPFCNGRPRLVAPVWDLLPYCECLRCGVKTSMSMTNAEAIAAWNRRASPSTEDIRREALEEAAKVADEAQATAREEIAEEKAEEGYDPYAFGSGFLGGELTAAVNIAKAIRALATEGTKPPAHTQEQNNG